MTFLQIFLLALIQGITEFLPISSSGHLILLPLLTSWPDQGLLLDVAVHVGTLLAVMIYFRRDVLRMALGMRHLSQGRRSAEARLVSLIALSALPIILAGPVLLYFDLTGLMRNAALIGWTTLGFGILLYIADQLGVTIYRLEHLRMHTAIWLGLAQILALVPGTSRSGITITAARIFGFERRDAARISMLMSIPTIAGAGLLGGIELYRSGETTLQSEAVFAATLAFGSALLAIRLFMKWLERASLTPFVIYRILLGAGLLIWVYYFN